LEAVRTAVATQRLGVAFSPGFLAYFGHPDPQVRAEARQRVKEGGRAFVPHLVAALGHEYLGVRIAAWQLLGDITKERITFDPWAPAAERDQMRQALAAALLSKEPERK
jgi:hypothetical protein